LWMTWKELQGRIGQTASNKRFGELSGATNVSWTFRHGLRTQHALWVFICQCHSSDRMSWHHRVWYFPFTLAEQYCTIYYILPQLASTTSNNSLTTDWSCALRLYPTSPDVLDTRHNLEQVRDQWEILLLQNKPWETAPRPAFINCFAPISRRWRRRVSCFSSIWFQLFCLWYCLHN
jgi:hypothetical protein